MVMLRGTSGEQESPHILEVDRQGQDVLLWIHPPEKDEPGNEILVPRVDLLDAVRRGKGRINGVVPKALSPRACEIESTPSGLRVMVHPVSDRGSWAVLVAGADLEAALK